MMNKTVLITGSSRGIGRAMALAFAEKGCKVAINYYKSEEQAKALEAEILRKNGVCAVFKADVSDREQVFALFKEVKEKLGEVDILINNAAIAQQKLFTDISPEEWHKMFAVNMDSAFHCCQAALPDMIHKKEGRILNISSMWGEVGGSCEVSYSAAKAALIGFTKALAKELSLSGITVNCISPGMIDTEMNAHLSPEDKALVEEEIPMGYSGAPEDVAKAALFLCSPDASYITGQVLRVNGGLVV